MSDDGNVVDFSKALSEAKSDKAVTIEERVANCMECEDCSCKYCNYKKHAANMIVEFLSRDVLTFEKNNNASLCTYDLKDIFSRAIKEVKKLEKEDYGEE